MTTAIDERSGADLAALLGVETESLVCAIREGLPFTAYERLVDLLGVPSRDLAAVLSIPERTLQRRKAAGRLTREESDRLVRVARLTELAREVFEGDTDRAMRWLTAPKSLLGGESPLTRADTGPGAREVEDMLYAIEYSMPV